MIEPRLRTFIDAAAGIANLPTWHFHDLEFPPGVWLEGLVLQESSGRPDARRYEAHQDAQADGDNPGRDDGQAEDDASYGLMQVMGYNVKALLGVPASTPVTRYSALYFEPLGMAFGLVLLRDELRSAEGDVATALARYNGGLRGNPGPNGQLRNQFYVDGVARHAAAVLADRRRG